MANPSCPRCGGRTELDSRNPMTWTCSDCRHTWVEQDDDAGHF